MKENVLRILLEIGTLLTAERDRDRLLELILRKAMEVTGADAGTLYMLSGDALAFRIMITRSLNVFKGGKGDPIDLPPVRLRPENVCAAAVLERALINVPDVYDDDRYDFSGPRRYDAMTGYKTTSVLVSPMENDDGDIIGVLQLINATDERGAVVPFTPDDERVVSSIASLAAVCLTNMLYAAQVTELLHGFIRVMSTAIDARSPYNANHTRNMVRYAEAFFDYEERTGGEWLLTGAKRDEFLMSVWLHDIGKLVTPAAVMDKSTRLGDSLERVENRFARILLLNRLARAEGRITDGEYARRVSAAEDALAAIRRFNGAGFLTDDDLAVVRSLRDRTYEEEDGTSAPLLTAEEAEQLSVRRGTLTDGERSVMQEHVVLTARMLSGLEFPKVYEHIPAWASAHHELLNGSGYPDGLSADAIPWQVRLLTILDVYEALTACDRPYKPPMPAERALAILSSMVAEGKLDGALFREFSASLASRPQ